MDAASAAIVAKPASVDGLLDLASRDMAGVDALIRDRMQSEVPVIPALAEHLIGGSAKRLRPLLTIAAARLAGAKIGLLRSERGSKAARSIRICA